MQELLRYDEPWTGTEGNGGHITAQEDEALAAKKALSLRVHRVGE
jgi:hypothetical protein